MLSKEAIKEFQTIYKAEYGEDITAEDAEKKGMNLIRLYKAILGKP